MITITTDIVSGRYFYGDFRLSCSQQSVIASKSRTNLASTKFLFSNSFVVQGPKFLNAIT